MHQYRKQSNFAFETPTFPHTLDKRFFTKKSSEEMVQAVILDSSDSNSFAWSLFIV